MKEEIYHISKKFMISLFSNIFTNTARSDFYKKYVFVEPVLYIKLNESIITDCVCIAKSALGIDHLGRKVAKIVDSEASEHIEQGMIIEKDYILICDNPILFPHDRLGNLLSFLEKNKEVVQEICGIIHYHINEPDLNANDVAAMKRFTSEMAKLGKSSQLGLVISQDDPTENFRYLDNKDEFINHLFSELNSNRIQFSGYLFSGEQIKPVSLEWH